MDPFLTLQFAFYSVSETTCRVLDVSHFHYRFILSPWMQLPSSMLLRELIRKMYTYNISAARDEPGVLRYRNP
jgi:hypothetical protein